jgi:hypothetical protein
VLAGRLRHGIVALALLALTHWASFTMWPGIVGTGDAYFKIFIQPAIALLSIAAAWYNRYLTLATIAVTLPTLVDAAGFAAFAIAIATYGF